MGRPARRLVVGALVLLAVWAAADRVSASSTPSTTALVEGIVQEDGAAVLDAGWSISHPTTGRYVVRAPAELDFDVVTWDGAADVASEPIGPGAVEVRFAADGVPVDSRFTWRALVSREGPRR